MKGFLSNNIYFSGKLVLNQSNVILVDNGTIVDIVPKKEIPDSTEILDFGDNLIIPGLVDIQLNGCNGGLFNRDLDIQCLKKMERGNLDHGTTSFLPTLISSSDGDMLTAMKVIEEAMSLKVAPSVKGLHLEGPYIDTEKRGAHSSSFVRKLTDDMLKKIAHGGLKGVVKIVSLAPEHVAPEHIKKLVDSNIVVSYAHSAAEIKDVVAASKAGLSMVTHLYNAMPPLKGREPGVIGYAFSEKQLSAGIIVDFIHSDKYSVKAAYNAMGDRLFAVTDASFTGKDNDSFLFGNQKCTLKNGTIINEEGNLAGSAITLDMALQNISSLFGLEQAIKMCSTLPAKYAKINAGEIQKGYPADFAILSSFGEGDIEVIKTYLAGEQVFSK